jgi:ribosomal-protein-alanine N-acetyltransferase
MIYFESERLIFRDWLPVDLPEFQRMNADPVVMEFFQGILTYEETDVFYEKIKAEIQSEGYGLFAVELKETCEFLGFIGFHKANLNLGFDPFVEIGWRLKKEAWGNGYATEGAKRCMTYGFEQLGFSDVYSFTSIVNTRSERVMRKIGMKRKMVFDHPRIEKNHLLCRHVLYHISNVKTSKGKEGLL